MKLGHIEIFVSDPLKAREFYQHILGFELVDVQGEQYAWFRKDQLEILLRPNRTAPGTPTYQDAPSAIVLYTANLSESKRELESRGLEFHGTDGSPNCLTFRDLDGNWFQLAENDS